MDATTFSEGTGQRPFCHPRQVSLFFYFNSRQVGPGRQLRYRGSSDKTPATQKSSGPVSMSEAGRVDGAFLERPRQLGFQIFMLLSPRGRGMCAGPISAGGRGHLTRS